MARRQGKTQREQMRLLVFMQGSVLSWPKKCIFHSLISGKKCKKLKGWQKLFLRLADNHVPYHSREAHIGWHLSLGCTVLEMATSKPPWSQYEGAGTPHFGAFTTGLVNVLKLIQPIKDKYSGVTYADLFQLASATAIEEAGGPKIPMKYGRVDVTGPEQCPAERKLPG
ncbi:putative L-ascorbate peroxidase 8, chloroplastic [Ananas comosus]|nr:putative L-ascorbate peroxidase 8, chloroplastic [Ananas comosus]